MSASYSDANHNPFRFNPTGEQTPPKAVKRLAAMVEQPVQATAPTPVQPPLSPTERIVLGHLMKGLTERQAAEQMQRSHNTVHVHIRNIYRKLGVSSRKMLFQVVDANPDLMDRDEPRSSAA